MKENEMILSSIKPILNRYESLFFFIGLWGMIMLSYIVLNHKSTMLTYEKDEEGIVYNIEFLKEDICTNKFDTISPVSTIPMREGPVKDVRAKRVIN